jgi:acyl-CoA thioester hydrolase
MSTPAPDFRTSVKVYLEDTDAQGIVYHANYLKFFERARTDYFDVHGVGLKNAQDRGYRFVVYSVDVKFHRAATLGDTLEIRTVVSRSSPFRILFQQKAFRPGEPAAVSSAKVDVVCIGPNGELSEIPSELLAIPG